MRGNVRLGAYYPEKFVNILANHVARIEEKLDYWLHHSGQFQQQLIEALRSHKHWRSIYIQSVTY